MKQFDTFLLSALSFLILHTGRGADLLLGDTMLLPQVIERGAHHRVIETHMLTTNEVGDITILTNSYTELATGLHYQKDGEWLESEDRIEITPTGAKADKGSHTVVWSANINTPGAIRITTPDGKEIKTHVLGLAYSDATSGNTVVLAEIKDSVGQILPGGNEIVFLDAFSGIKADVRFRYTKAGLHQDILLREAPKPPQTYGAGFAPETTRLEVITEFIDPPDLVTRSAPIEGKNQARLVDETLDFGAWQIGSGKAFDMEDPSGPSVRVGKTWETTADDRHLLVEAVPYEAMKEHFGKLPIIAQILPREPSKQRKLSMIASTSMSKKQIQFASLPLNNKGVVLDWVGMVSASNFVFKGDETYFVSNNVVILTGTTVLERGTVVKMDSGSSSKIDIRGPLICKTESYHPAIFTAKDDNSLGSTITGSSGNPTNSFYGNPMLAFDGAYTSSAGPTLQNVRFRHGKIGLGSYNIAASTPFKLYHAQFVRCETAIDSQSATFYLGNGLINDVTSAFSGTSSTGRWENVTVHKATTLISTNSLNAYNCLFVAVTNLGSYGGSNNSAVSDPTGIFLTAVAGAHYLATNSYRNAGTAAIDLPLLGALRSKTTYAPTLLGGNITGTTVYGPNTNVLRDTDVLDIGWHYDPIDYSFTNSIINGSTLIFSNGVAVSVHSSTGFDVKNTGLFISEGTPLKPNRLFRFSVVQEQYSPAFPAGSTIVGILSQNSPAPKIQMRFTELPALAGPNGARAAIANYNKWFQEIILRDCQLKGSRIEIEPPASYTYTALVGLTNNLFQRASVLINRPNTYYTCDSLTAYLRNNLFWNGSLTLVYQTVIYDVYWDIRDNFFDGVSLSHTYSSAGYPVYVPNSHNAYRSSTWLCPADS